MRSQRSVLGNRSPMRHTTNMPESKHVIPVSIQAVFPTNGGCALFLGDDTKVFVIYVDQMSGAAIAAASVEVPKIRPMTHDLMGSMLIGLGAKVERVVINDFRKDVFFARLILSQENEVREKAVVELDSRPSDAIALALRQDAPLFVSRKVWDGVEDMSPILKKISEKGFLDDEPPFEEGFGI